MRKRQTARMSKIISGGAKFTTERMRISHWADRLADDLQRAQLIFEISEILTSDVQKHLPDPLQLSDPTHVENWVTARAAESEVLMVRDRVHDDLLGLLILAEFSVPDTGTRIHIGYLLGQSRWGKGYGTELIAGLVAWLRQKNQKIQLLGGVEQDNVGSIKVLQKNGFSLASDLSDESNHMYQLQL